METLKVIEQPVVFKGRSPYINAENQHWMVWDDTAKAFADTGITAATPEEITTDIAAAEAAKAGAEAAKAEAQTSAAAAGSSETKAANSATAATSSATAAATAKTGAEAAQATAEKAASEALETVENKADGKGISLAVTGGIFTVTYEEA